MIIRGAVFVALLGLWAGTGWAAGHTVVEVKPCPEAWVNESGPGACRYEIGYSQWHTVEVDGMPVDCRDRLEAAMRVMEKYIPKFVDPVERRRMAKSSDWTTDDLVCRNCYFGGEEWVDTRSIEQKLAGDRARYEREQEDRGRQIVEDAKERWAYQQWDAVKRECWRGQ